MINHKSCDGCRFPNSTDATSLCCLFTWLTLSPLCPQLAKKIREKFNRYLDVANRNKQVVEASYTAHLTSPLTAVQDCCTIPPSMME